VHPDLQNLESFTSFTRLATRAICVQGPEILLLYTKRYDDLSLPGGGLDPGEDKVSGMVRELKEETGARNIRNIKSFGLYEEFRPWYKNDFDVQRMLSYCYTCEIDKELGPTKYEDYEIKNGMQPFWINIHEAVEKNEQTLKNSAKKGMSIERETFLLKKIATDLSL